MKIDWKYVLIFILIALGLSYPIQQGYLSEFYQSISKNSFLAESGYLLAGFSTFIAALITLAIHQNLSNRISVFGDDNIKNSLILSLSIIAFTISGLNNDFGMNKYLYGFSFALTNEIRKGLSL